MSALKDTVVLLLQCRDHWYEETEDDAVRNKLFSQFVDWATKHFLSDSVSKEGIVQLLETSTAPFSPSLYTGEALREKVVSSSLSIAYRIAYAVDRRNGEVDTRVKDLFDFIVKEEFEMDFYGLICPAFTYLGENEKNRGKGNSRFQTGAATRFQQLLFLCAIVEMSSMICKGSCGSRKKMKSSKRLVSVSRSFNFRGKLRNVAQKVGYSIHSVVNDWNVLSAYVGFKDVEQMVLPYSRICATDVRFRFISSKSEGFPQASQAFRFIPDLSLTSEPGETFSCVTARPSEVDGYLRFLTKVFLEDVSNSFRSESLYISSTPEFFTAKATSRKARISGLPRRFLALNADKLDAVRDYFSPTAMSASAEKSGMNNDDGNGPADKRECQAELNVGGKHPIASAPIPVVHANTNHSNTTDEDEYWNRDICTGTGIDNIEKRLRSELLQKKVSENEVERSKACLRKEIQPFARMWCCQFSHLEEVDELKSIQPDFRESVQLSFYDNRASLGDEDGDIGSLNVSEDEMRVVIDLIYSELRVGGHGILFCTMIQYTHWVDKFMEKWDKLCTEARDNSSVFVVESEPLVFVSSSLPFSFPKTMSEKDYEGGAAQFALHITKRGKKNRVGNRSKTAFSEGVPLSTSFPRFVNVINNVDGLMPRRNVNANQSTAISVHDLGVRNKPQTLLKELIIRYSSPGDLVLDRFAGRYGVAEACLTLSDPRRFVGCEQNSDVHSIGLDDILNTVAEQILAYPRKFKISKDGIEAAKVIVASRIQSNAIGMRQNIMPASLPPYQCFPGHIICSLANEWNDRNVLMKCVGRPVQQWPKRFRDKLNTTNVDLLLKQEAVAYNVYAATSTISHPQAGNGLFAARSFQPHEVICTYYGTIVYTDLLRKDRQDVVYGQGILSLDPERFRKYALQIDATGSAFRDVRELFDGRLAIFVVPAPFCAGSIINDPSYMEDDSEKHGEEVNTRERRKSNAEFVPKALAVKKPRDLLEHDLIEIVATRLINTNEEIFVSYGKADVL